MPEAPPAPIALADEAATRSLGARLGRALLADGGSPRLVTLAGDLGAGKTTLVRGLLTALGMTGPVRSPTYTLIESYPIGARTVHHLDWYRLAEAAELDGLGFRELLTAGQWLLVEWPERAPAVAALADLAVRLSYDGAGRVAALAAQTPAGSAVLRYFEKDLG